MKLIEGIAGKYGNFDLEPEVEYKILQSFIDYSSGLLVAHEQFAGAEDSPLYATRNRPKVSVIDTNIPKILDFYEWKNYFHYEETETFSQDGTLKEVRKRIHDEELKNDFYEAKLFESKTGKVLSTSSSVAFSSTRLSTLIERHYEWIQQKKEYQKSLEKGIYPEEIYQQYLSGLKEGTIVFTYYDKTFFYKLIFSKGSFVLITDLKAEWRNNWEHIVIQPIKTFDTLQDYWIFFTATENWYRVYQPSEIHPVLIKFIITTNNSIRESGNFTYSDYNIIHRWDRKTYNERIHKNVYWQFCSNCRARVMYYPRYPKTPCGNCFKLIRDEEGNKLDYDKVHTFGPYSLETGYEIQLKSNNNPVRLFIGENEYLVREAYFGGEVYLLKE